MNFLTFSLALASVVLGAPTSRDIPEGVIAIPLSRVQGNATAHTGTAPIGRLHATVPEPLQNQVVEYLASFNIGTPGQSLQAALDTGSSDLWVFSSAAESGGFDASKSSTYQLLEKNGFSITYVSGSANGDWASDNIALGGASVKGQQFAVVNQNDVGQDVGVFGIGRVQDEAQTDRSPYDNFPVSLKKQGYISKNAYSLYLDNLDAASGSVLFGGVDSAKYTGQLYTVPFTSTTSLSAEFTVAGLTYSGVLDSGTSFTYLPVAAFEALRIEYGWNLKYDSANGIYYTDKLPKGPGVTYSFSGAKITVPLSELFIDIGGHKYALTIIPNTASSGYTLLGDSTLRSAYVVYDLDSNVLGIAQASYSSSSNITPITGDTIPGSQPAPGTLFL